MIRDKRFVVATVFSLTFLFWSCSKSDAPFDHADSAQAVVHITTSIVCSPQSKAPAVDNGATKYVMSDIGFLRKDDVSTPSSFQDITSILGSRDASGKITFSPTVPNYNKNNDNAYFVAYWPTVGTTVEEYGVEWNIDGKTDILYAPVWNAGSYTKPVTKGMTFEHQLSQLEVVLKTGAIANLSDVQAAWGQVAKIELVGTSSTAVYDNINNSISYSTTSADISLLSADYQTEFLTTSIPASDNKAVCAAGMFAPTTDVLTLRLTFSPVGTSGITSTTVQIPLEGGFVRGKRHKLTLDFEAVQTLLVVYSELTDWRTAFRSPSEIKDPSLEVLKPSNGFLYWSFAEIIKSGSFTGLSGTTSLTGSTTVTYNRFDNTANGAKNGGYRVDIAAVLRELPYHRLEVAKQSEPAPADWSAAWRACKEKQTNDGGWRLPRMSELMWMSLNRVELQKTADFEAFVPGSLLSATEGSADECWYMNVGTTDITAPVRGAKSGASYSVRCVKEL